MGLSSTSPRRATPCLLGLIWLPQFYLPGCKRTQPRRATSCPRLLTDGWDATPNRILPFAWKFGWLVETSLSSLPEPPSSLLLFSGIFRHATRPRSRFAQRLFFAQFLRLSGRQV